MKTKFLTLIGLALLTIGASSPSYQESTIKKRIAIANYGPHESLNQTIQGIKEGLIQQGYKEGHNIEYEELDVGFNTSLIPQMIQKLKHSKPDIIITLTTPVTQYAKGTTTDIPIVFAAITDPVEAKILKAKDRPQENITGSSDKQDLNLMLQLGTKLLPKARSVGILYSLSEANDHALIKMLKKETEHFGLDLVAIPVSESRDIPSAMHSFRGEVDFIYVGSSGPIQPALPVIARQAKRLRIPIFNMDESAVLEGMALASYGVNYLEIGKSTGQMVSKILRGKKAQQVAPIYPSSSEHKVYINKGLADEFGIKLPEVEKATLVDRGSYVKGY